MKKLLLLLILAFCTSVVDAQLTYKNIIIGTNTSANGRAPQTSHRNTKCVYYIPASEMSDGGVGAGTQLKGIGFSYKDATAAMTATGSLKIYLQNTTDADYQKGTSFSAAIATMTKVSDGTVTLTSTAATDFEFQNGDAFTYAGGGLYVAFEWSNAGTLGTANTAFCNNSQINGKDGLFSSSSTSSATGASNTIATSPFRPYTRFAYQLLANDAGVSSVYAMSTAPVNEGLQKIAARITNNGLAVQNNIDVTLTITGANTFTSIKNIATLASEASTVVTFDDFVPTVKGTNTINVSISTATDDNNANNSLQVLQEVTDGRFSHNIGTASSGAYGYNDGTGVYAAKYKANGTVNVKALKFKVGNDADNSIGKPIQAVLINSAGVTLATSAIYNIEAGDIDKFLVLNFTPANAILTNEEFYVGVALMGDGVNKFYPIAVQPESPVRPGTFYSTGNAYDSGATTTFGSTSVKPMIEAITSNAVLNSNITTVNAVYALGKNPLALGAGEIMQAVITNDGETIMNNVPVSLAISGANTFASAQTIVKLGAGQSATVSFGAFTATAKGTHTITVTSNNETAKALSINQVITDGIFSYANEAPRTSNYGASNGDIIFLVKHSLTGTKKIKAVRLRIGSNAANTGKSIYAVLADGNGNVVAQSDSYIIQSADLDTDKDFLLQTPTTITNQNFMVGIALETAQQFYPIGVQTENPARTGAYYTRARTSNTLTLSSALYRYMISAITEDEVLPVTISSFTAKLNNNKVNLSWTVGIETNVNRYVVERSQNGTDFISVAEVAANGSSNYAALDVKPELGVNYYRLKGVDNDGTISPFNELRSVKVISLAVQEAQIYPNPLVGNTLKVSLVNYIKGTYNYKLTNVAGKVIQKGSFDHNGSESSSIAFNSQLPKGVYVLQIVHGSEVIQSKLVKQ